MKTIKDDLQAINALDGDEQIYKKWVLGYKMSKAHKYIKNLPSKMRDDFGYFVLSRFIFPGYQRPRAGTPESGFFVAEELEEKKNESI